MPPSKLLLTYYVWRIVWRPWRPFLGHQARSWTTLRRGNVFYYVYKRFFYFCHVFTFLTFFYFCLNVFTSIIDITTTTFVLFYTCDFLLVFHCNYMSILYRFWDISTYFFPKILRGHVTLNAPPCCKTLTCVMAVLLAYNLQTNLKFLASSAPEIWPGPHNVEMSHVTLESLGSPITKLWMAVQNAENGVVMGHSKVMGNAAIPRSAYDFLFDFDKKETMCLSFTVFEI